MLDAISIEEKTFYDKKQIEDKEQFLVKRKAMREEYEADKKKYDASREKVRKVSDQIYSVFYQARKDVERTERYKKIFEEYVSMAGGNKEQAQAFFDKAYKESIPEDVYTKVFKA